MRKFLLCFILCFLVGSAFAETELDYMEYANDAAAQAAYVTDATYTADLIPDMTSNTAPSGVASATSEYNPTYAAWKAMNDSNVDEYDCWVSSGSPTVEAPQYLQYQFTSGKIITKYTITTRNYDVTNSPRDWKLQGSNNGSDWTDLDTVVDNDYPGQNVKESFTFVNNNSYTYYRIRITDKNTGNNVSIGEFELMGINLQCYSEDTIKQQGSYSLKAIAVITDSLNDTLTKSELSIDLSGVDELKYYIYSKDRTGSHIKIGIHDSGGTTTEHTANISSTEAWEEQTIDLSGVADGNKDNIDSIIITILNADAANVAYFDDMFAEAVAEVGQIIFID